MAASEVAPAAERAELELTFHRGMRVLLGNWSAMRLLVQEGGSAKHPLLGLQELEDELHFNFEEKWDAGKDVDSADVEDFLHEFIADEFNMDVEDDSFAEVAKLITRMYDECRRGDLAEVNRFLAAKEETTAKFLGLPPPRSTPPSPPPAEATDAAGAAAEAAFLEQGAPSSSASRNEPDEDGWVTAAPKKRRGRKKIKGQEQQPPSGGSGDAGDA